MVIQGTLWAGDGRSRRITQIPYLGVDDTTGPGRNMGDQTVSSTRAGAARPLALLGFEGVSISKTGEILYARLTAFAVR